jgi:hypothetical protein
VTTIEQFLTAALGVTWGGIGLAFAVGKWARSREAAGETLLFRIEQLEKRMEQAGNKMSDLASAVQGLPDRLRHDFVLRVEWDATERRRKET